MRAFLFLAFALLLSSCFDKGDCLYSNTNLARISLMDLDTASLTHPISLDTVYMPEQAVYIPVDSNVTAFVLPVDPTHNETKFVLRRSGGLYDTLVLGYTNQVIVLSPDCGSAVFQKNLEVKYSTFDSVRVVTNQLLTSAKVNIEIRL